MTDELETVEEEREEAGEWRPLWVREWEGTEGGVSTLLVVELAAGRPEFETKLPNFLDRDLARRRGVLPGIGTSSERSVASVEGAGELVASTSGEPEVGDSLTEPRVAQ